MRTKEGNKSKDIREAAIKIFAEYGYHNAKIAKISELAGVATGSIYLYFKNKEELLHNIFNYLWKKMYDNSLYLRDNTQISPAKKLDNMIDLIFDIFKENPNLAIVIIDEESTYLGLNKGHNPKDYDQFFETATEIIAEGIKKNIFTHEIDINLLKLVILGSFKELMQYWIKNKKSVKISDIQTNFKFIIKNGIMKHK